MEESVKLEQLLKHTRWMKALARSLVLDDARAHDIVQQTWVAALKTPPRSMASAKAWLGKVVRNFALRSRQEEGRRRQREERTAQPEKIAHTPQELLQRVELQREVADAVTRLHEPYRSIILLRFFEELTVTEIAQRQGIPVTTIHSRLSKALDQLRHQLDRKYQGNRQAWCLLFLTLIPTREAWAAGISAPSATLPGILVMKGLAMKTSVKIAAVVVSIVITGALFTLSGIFSSGSTTEEPIPIAPHSLAEEPGLKTQEAQASEPETVQLPTVREALPPSQPEATPTPRLTARIEAKVVDFKGYPLAGAHLAEVAPEVSESFGVSRRDGTVQCDLEVGEEDRVGHIEISMRGYTSRFEHLRLTAGCTVHLGTVTLLPGGMIRGQVRTPQGQAVPGAKITFDTSNASDRRLKMMRFFPSEHEYPNTITDASGSFELVGLSPGFVRLWARAPEMDPTFTDLIEVQENFATSGIEITMEALKDANRISGRVLDPSGNPVPFAELDFGFPSDHGLTITKQAGGDGRFEYTLEEHATVSITARDPKHRFGSTLIKRVEAGEQDIELYLVAGEQVRLMVRGESGNEIDHFHFKVLSENYYPTLQEGTHSADSDEPPTFLVPGQNYLVQIIAPLYKISTVGPFREQDLDEWLEVQLEPAPGLHGVVRNVTQPLEGAWVTLHELIPADLLRMHEGFRCWLDPRCLDKVQTNPSGEFVLTVRRAGEYVVRAKRKGFAATEWGPFPLDPEGPMEPVELILGEGGTIEGRVILPLDQDPTGTVVSLHRGDGHPVTHRTDPYGAYRFTGLMTGPWRMDISDEEIWTSTITVGPAQLPYAEEVQWNCEAHEGKTTHFDLKVVDEDAHGLEGALSLDNEPCQGWTAWLCPLGEPYLDNRGKWPTASLDPRGEFKLAAAAPGDYKLVIKKRTAEDDRIILSDVHLGALTTPFQCDLPTGTLVIENPGKGAVTKETPLLAYCCQAEVTFLSLIVPNKNQAMRLKNIPAGKGRLLRPTGDSKDPMDWKTVAEVFINAGQETRIQAP